MPTAATIEISSDRDDKNAPLPRIRRQTAVTKAVAMTTTTANLSNTNIESTTIRPSEFSSDVRPHPVRSATQNQSPRGREQSPSSAKSINTRPVVAIPAGVELPATSKGEADAMAVWLSFLLCLTEQTPERREYGHWINIHSEANRQLLGGDYRPRIIAMRAARIIETNDRYSTGRPGTAVFPKSYRISDEYRTGHTELRELVTKPARKKLAKSMEPNAENLGATGMHFFRQFENFSLSDDAYKDKALTRSPWSAANLSRWSHGYSFAIRCVYGRYHSILTQTPRVARKYLRYKRAADLSIVDVSAAQPLIIGFLAAHDITTFRRLSHSIIHKLVSAPLLSYVAGFLVSSVPADVQKWIDLCQRREIYRYFWEAIQSSPEPAWVEMRKKKGPQKGQIHPVDLRTQSERSFKRGSLIPLFDQIDATLRSPVFQIVQRDFPTIAKWVLDTKRNGHETTACLCQRLESHLMIDGCGEVLRRQHADEPVQPIHDAILCRSGFAPVAHGIIAEQFSRIGLYPQITTKSA
ncbi:hypothetical protein [Stieleria sedimenti]|uniref:hypothetical protein n=1 Tax=Stieleria sedimenti TaxID=2976331 RepID=UPI00217FC7EA|nr:hypothetical protein [Stieleria sedimenti]